MLKILVICAAVAAACLLQTGCGLFPSAAKDPATAKPAVAAAAAPDGIPKGQHYDEPIIIDNPDAFIGLLPGDDHDFYLPPPVEPKDSPKSTALLVDHVKYTHVKLKGLKSKDTMEDTPYPLKTPLIKITFLDGTDKAGSMEVNWAELAGVGIVTMVSTDANAKKLRWKREKQDTTQGKKRLGLKSKVTGAKYLVESVTFETDQGSKTAERVDDTTPVKISLCALKNGQPKCDLPQ